MISFDFLDKLYGC